MNKEDKKKREHLRSMVSFCKRIALDHYIAGNYKLEKEWERAAMGYQHQILMMYPRFQKAKERNRSRKIYVPVVEVIK